jgi:hypothetical protein
MGLVSLPVLNKIGNSNYWNNIWDSSNLFKKYFYLSLFLNKYFNLLFTDYSLNIINAIILNHKLKKGYHLDKFIKNKILKSFFLGKIWILKYQGWYLIIIKLFSTKILKKKDFSIKYKNKKWKNYYKYIYNNTFKNKNLNFLNYKNKF